MQFAPDGKTLFSFGSDSRLRSWDVAEGKELDSLLCSPQQTFWFTLSRDAKRAAVAGHDRKVRVWDVGEGRELRTIDVRAPQAQPKRFGPPGLAFAGDDRTLLGSLSNEGLVRRWDTITGKEAGEIKGLTFFLNAQCYYMSADGKCCPVVTGPEATLVELASGRVRQACKLPALPPPVPGPPPIQKGETLAALSPDGRTLAVGLTDGTLHFWDTGSGQELAARKLGVRWAHFLAFAPDGKTLAAPNADDGVILWDVPGPTARGRLVVKPVTAADLGELWKDLSAEDAARAWQAILRLESAPKEAVPFLQKELRATTLSGKAITRLIAQLDADQIEEREKATAELIRAGKAVEEAVQKSLDNKPSAEAKERLELILTKLADKVGPDLEEVRRVRVVEVLERIGTPEAQKVLEEVAKEGGSKLSAEALAAVERRKGKSTTAAR